MTTALENGEFFALFQPQVSVADGRVVAAEALLRWRRPGFGVIDPDFFVPYAEDHALMGPLGAFILERACRTASAWSGLVVAVNVSPTQFARPDFAGFVTGVADAAGLPLERLEIEITEYAAFGDLAQARETLATLRAQGVSIALDDLGCGHATPVLMDSLPLDRVKLARPLVEASASAEGAARLEDLVAHARRLGLAVTAEGVETERERAYLVACGCDRLQGYLFARPMSGQELAAFVGREP